MVIYKYYFNKTILQNNKTIKVLILMFRNSVKLQNPSDTFIVFINLTRLIEIQFDFFHIKL